uniref:Uncharacterized protein n=1 Tax=Cyclopterus lumpus TaxID=8103 RepID=A0A8C3G2Z2_CYCLU
LKGSTPLVRSRQSCPILSHPGAFTYSILITVSLCSTTSSPGLLNGPDGADQDRQSGRETFALNAVIAASHEYPPHSVSSRAMFRSVRTMHIARERLSEEKPPDFDFRLCFLALCDVRGRSAICYSGAFWCSVSPYYSL